VPVSAPNPRDAATGPDARALDVRDLVRRFRTGAVVGPTTFSVEAGERVALLGGNGSGKSTVIRCAAGTVTPTGGRVHVGAHPAGTLEARRLTGVMLAQERAFYLRLTGHANLLLFARLRVAREAEAAARVAALEEELELAHITSLRVDRCSTGMVQQLGFARALLGDPSVLLLDEPTRSLDDGAIERLWGALDRRPGLAVVIATHSAADAMRCDRSLGLGG
jgi:ABC-2 type transport system ATP-binding protein